MKPLIDSPLHSVAAGNASRLCARLPFAAAVLLATAAGSLTLWDPLQIDERAHIRRITRHLAASVRASLGYDLREQLLTQALLARSWGAQQSLSSADVESDAELFLEHNPTYVAAQWVDPSYRLRWKIARDADGLQRGMDVDPGRPLRLALETVARSLATNERPIEPVVTQAFRLADGKPADRVITPVLRAGALSGFFVTDFDIQQTLEKILTEQLRLGYCVSLGDEVGEIYRTPGVGCETESDWATYAGLDLPGVPWQVGLWPTAALLAEIRSPLPELALVLGGLLGLLLALAVHFARAERVRAAQLTEARNQVEARVRNRTAELRDANASLEAQVAERKRVEVSLRELSGRLLRVQDEEHRRFARELHDSTSQTLAATAFNLDRARQLVLSDKSGANDVLGECSTLLGQVLNEIRTVSFLLHPAMLDELGLEDALLWYVRGFSARSGIAVGVHLQPDLGRLPPATELAVFRVVQEALANIHRHSGSQTASISLSRNADEITLEVADRGRGIPPGILEEGSPTIHELGVGIAGMRERIRQLGGRLEIASGAGGARIRAVLHRTGESEPPHHDYTP